MSVSFNLLDEPFIPVLFTDGTLGELSLRGVLSQAPDIAELRDSSPLVTIALHRLLLCILHRVYNGPKTTAARLQIRAAKAFDQAKLDAYYNKWHDRFDLFHPDFPFLQRTGFKTKEPSGINRLCQERSRGNNAALFDHTTDNPPPAFSFAQTARAIIAEQAFAVGGGKSDTGNTTHAPLVSGAVVLAYGDSLFETLWLNLTIYDGASLPVVCDDDEDAPIWERKPKAPHELPNTPYGFLDYLVWPTRTLSLVPNVDESCVRSVYYAQGRQFQPAEAFFDPMIAYFRTDDGDRPVRYNEYRDLWRDSATLFQFGDNDSARGPNTLHTLRQLKASELPRSKTYRVSLIGLCTDKAKVLFWRHDTLPLRLEYLDDATLVKRLQDALALAEDVSKVALRPAAWATAMSRLTASEESSPDTARVSALVNAMAPERYYWSRLELPFREFLIVLAEAEEEQRDRVFQAWYWETLFPIANQAFERCVATIDTGRDLKAVTAGRRVLMARLKSIRRDHHIADRTTTETNPPPKVGAS